MKFIYVFSIAVHLLCLLVPNLVISQDKAKAFFEQGKKAQALGKYDEAYLCYSQTLMHDPNHMGALINRANTCFTQQKYEKALLDLNKFTELYPADLEGHERLGNVNMMLGAYKNAYFSFTNALEIKPSAELFTARGQALFNLSRNNEAKKDFDAALHIDPHYTDAIIAKGNAFYVENDYLAARQVYMQAVAQRTKDEQLLYNLGVTLAQLGDYSSGMKYLSDAIALSPNTLSYSARAFCYYKQNKPEPAEQDALLSHNMDVRNADAYNVLGLLSLDKQAFEISLKYFKEALKWQESHAEATYNIGYTLYLQKKMDESLMYLTRAVMYPQTKGKALYARANIMYLKEEKDAACRDFNEAVKVGFDAFTEEDSSIFCKE